MSRRSFLSLLVVGSSIGFQSSTTVPFRSSSSSLAMSYLDSLSPPPEEKPDESSKPLQNKPKWADASGGIPTGRGPQASYLQAMSAGVSNEDSQQQQDDAMPEVEDPATPTGVFEKKERPASWSKEYLTDFLTGDDSRTDVRNLLTQRSIQSFMFMLEQCRDPHSAKWIQEDFLQTGNLLDFHGTGAAFIEKFGGTWDAALIEMSQRPSDRIIISAKRRGRGHGGWSKNNPYLQERWVEMPIDIHPSNLCNRILSVREQIAKEWLQDLDALLMANDQILDSYFSKVRALRQADQGGQGEAVGSMGVAFDRTAFNLVNDKSRFATTASSPFRRASFDLLYTLCTQAAIHRLLREYIANNQEEDIGFVFLKRFYTERAADFFDGYLPFGRADEFIDELLQTPPSLLTAEDGRTTGLIDPLGTAENIIRMRNKIASDWKESMRQVPDAHIQVKQAVLSKQMQGSVELNNNNNVEDLNSFQ